VGVNGLNIHLNQWYEGGAADPLGMNQPPPVASPNWGGIASAGITGLSLAGDAIGMANQPLGIETQAPSLQRSATGEPVYNTGDFYNQSTAAKPQGATGGEVLGSAGKGAMGGLMAALALGGPVGWLAGGGLALGAALGIGGGAARRRKQQHEKHKAIVSAKAAQKNFNTASIAFDEQQTSQDDYLKRMDNTNRLYNLYGS
jgi:hypothetical protein